MSKWSLKLLGGAVETTGTSSTISIPTNYQNYGVTYIVKYEDDNGSTGETSVKQAAGTESLRITNIVIIGLSTQPGYDGLVAYSNIDSNIIVRFKYEYTGSANAVQESWFKFSLQDKNGNQMAVLENPTLNKSSSSGSVIISQSLFASLPSGTQGDNNHKISRMVCQSYSPPDIVNFTKGAPLPSNYYDDPDDKMALYSVVADTRTNVYNSLVIFQTTPPTPELASNVFLKADVTPRIINLRLGIWEHWPGQTAYYRCYEKYPSSLNSIYCFSYYEGRTYYEEGISISVEYDAAGSLTISDKTTLQVCNASDDSVIYEFEITYLDNPIVPQWSYYGNTCESSNVMSYDNWIDFKNTLNIAPNSGVHNIYIRWKNDPSIRTSNLEVDTQASYCGS